jgi:hypothetical protein
MLMTCVLEPVSSKGREEGAKLILVNISASLLKGGGFGRIFDNRWFIEMPHILLVIFMPLWETCFSIKARIRNRRGRRRAQRVSVGEQRQEWVKKGAEWILQNDPTQRLVLENQKF